MAALLTLALSVLAVFLLVRADARGDIQITHMELRPSQGATLLPSKARVPSPIIQPTAVRESDAEANQFVLRLRCVNSGGEALKGVEVTPVQLLKYPILAGPAAFSAVSVAVLSGVDGKAELVLAFPPPWPLMLRVSSPSTRREVLPVSAPATPGTYDLGAIVLKSVHPTKVRILDSQGVPARIARVRWLLQPPPMASTLASDSGLAETDEAGVFSIPAARPGLLSGLVLWDLGLRAAEWSPVLIGTEGMDAVDVHLAEFSEFRVKLRADHGAILGTPAFLAKQWSSEEEQRIPAVPLDDDVWKLTLASVLELDIGIEVPGYYPAWATVSTRGGIVSRSGPRARGANVRASEAEVFLRKRPEELIIQVSDNSEVEEIRIGHSPFEKLLPSLRLYGVKPLDGQIHVPTATDLGPGSYVLLVSKDLRASARVGPLSVSDFDSPLRVSLGPSPTVRVHCVDSAGRGVSDAAVSVYGDFRGQWVDESPWGQVIASGSPETTEKPFLVAAVSPDGIATVALPVHTLWRVVARRNGFALASGFVSSEAGDLTLVMQAGGAVAVRDNEEPSSLRLMNTRVRELLPALRPRVEENTAVFEHVPVGRYLLGSESVVAKAIRLFVRDDWQAVDAVRSLRLVDVADGTTTSLSLPGRTDGGGFVYGKIALPWAPARFAYVDVVPDGLKGLKDALFAGRVTETGEFCLGPVGGGSYKIRLFVDGPLAVYSESLSTGGAVDLRVDLRPSWARLNVTGAGSNDPSQVVLYDSDGNAQLTGFVTAQTTLVWNVAPGVYRIALLVPGKGDEVGQGTTITVAEGEYWIQAR